MAEAWPDDSRGYGPGIAEGMAEGMADACPKVWPDDGSPISDLQVRTKKQDLVGVVPQKSTTTPPPPPLVMSPLRYAKALQHHAFIGARLKVPHKLHDDFRRLLGGADTDGRLVSWYHAVDAEIEISGESIVPDVFKWLEARFRHWASSTADDAAIRAWVEGA
jgi:hypothetical protein